MCMTDLFLTKVPDALLYDKCQPWKCTYYGTAVHPQLKDGTASGKSLSYPQQD